MSTDGIKFSQRDTSSTSKDVAYAHITESDRVSLNMEANQLLVGD